MDMRSTEGHDYLIKLLEEKYPLPSISEDLLTANDQRKQKLFDEMCETKKEDFKNELTRAGILFDGVEPDNVEVYTYFVDKTTGELLNGKVIAFTRSIYDRKVAEIENRRMAAYDFVMSFYPSQVTEEAVQSFVQRLPD